MKRPLLIQAFFAMLVVALLTVGLSGLITRAMFDSAFTSYLRTLPTPMGGGYAAFLPDGSFVFDDMSLG